MLTFCGCYYILPSYQSSLFGGHPQRQYLPLVSSSFHSTILNNTSQTVLAQKFTNPSKDTAIQECVYTFPLYADVSVVKFTCRIGKKVLYGVVKEKFKAKKIFDEAVAKGETAGLLEQSLEASDVFSTKLGNVPGGESVFVELTYIGELKNGDGDSVRFTIPTSIAPRYGSGPFSVLDASATTLSDSEDGIKIVVDINIPDGSFIKGVQSPSHPISVSMGTVSTATEADSTMSKASVTLALGSAALEKDFVLIVQSKNSGVPKALLETHPSIPNQRALMATLVPKFTLPPSRPELVFVADRSGSMNGNIPMLISALKVFLKSMPAGVKFNICSFGSSCQFLWPKSRTYDAGTLKEASDHVETFAANFGGTETFGAIKATIERRWADLKLDIILLTDGDIWGQDQMFKYLTEQTEATNGKIRVFPLGIGNGVSHALIEGIARAGNGFAQAVQEGERLDTAVVKMLRGALTPHITDYSLEVKYAKEDDDFEVIDKVTDGMKVILIDPKPAQKQPISLFDNTAEPEKADMESGDPKLPEIPSPKLLQAPHKIPSLFAFSRTTAYILMSPETFQRNPTSVIFRATSEHGPLELEIPIEALAQPGKIIHQLAAKKATQDMEEGRGWIYEARDQNGELVKDRYSSSFDDLVKKECVRLGEKFQVAGKWCSFVAVAATEPQANASTTAAKQNGKLLRILSLTARSISNTNKMQTDNLSEQNLSNSPGNMDVLQDFDFDSFLHENGDVDKCNFDTFAPEAPARAVASKWAGKAKKRCTKSAAPSSHVEFQEMRRSSRPAAVGNYALQDYQMQHMLLEQQNKKRLLMARQEHNMQQASATHSVRTRGSTLGRSPVRANADVSFGTSAPAYGRSVQPASPSQGNSLFGSSGAPAQQSGGLFGNSQASAMGSALPSTGGFFSSSQAPVQQSGGLFGGFGAQQASSTSPFGSQSPAQQGGSLLPTSKSKGRAPPPQAMARSAFLSSPAYYPSSASEKDEKPDWNAATNEQKIHALIELQNFDGTWPGEKESEILEILGIETGGHPDGIDGTIWITLVVVGVLEKKMAEEEGTWALVVEKAKNWLSERESASLSEMKKAQESLKI